MIYLAVKINYAYPRTEQFSLIKEAYTVVIYVLFDLREDLKRSIYTHACLLFPPMISHDACPVRPVCFIKMERRDRESFEK